MKAGISLDFLSATVESFKSNFFLKNEFLLSKLLQKQMT